MKKRTWIAIITILLITSSVTIYFSEASVQFWVQPYEVKRVDNQWYTITGNSTSLPGSNVKLHLDNRGLLDASFYIIVRLTNATFSEKPFDSAQIIDSHQLWLPYTLHAGEETDTIVNFSIDNSMTVDFPIGDRTHWFEISVSFETNQWLIRSTEANWAGQSSFMYYRAGNNTWMSAMIS